MSTARHKKSEPLVPFWGNLDHIEKNKADVALSDNQI